MDQNRTTITLSNKINNGIDLSSVEAGDMIKQHDDNQNQLNSQSFSSGSGSGSCNDSNNGDTAAVRKMNSSSSNNNKNRTSLSGSNSVGSYNNKTNHSSNSTADFYYKTTTKCAPSRTEILRGLLTASLLAAIATCTAVSYGILHEAEMELGRQTYFSIAASAVTGAQAITRRKVQGSEVMAAVLSHTIPDASSWPLITMNGYMPIAEKIAQLSDSTTQSLVMLMDHNPTSIQEFEEHTRQVYREQGRPEDAGYSDFGFGVWKPDENEATTASCEYEDCRVHETADEPPAWDAARDIVAPVMMHNQPAANSLLYNLYSQADRGIHIDSMFDCVDRAKEQQLLQNNAANVTSPSCAVITDILELKVRPGPSGLLFYPIFPANDPTTFVAFAVTSIHWEEVLMSVVPNYVNGLRCVVKTDTTTYTYEIREGDPYFLGEGNLHDSAYDDYAETIVLNPDLDTGALSSAVYTLTVYPSEEMLRAFSTNSPVTVSLGFFAVVAFCALIFFLYDYLMRYEANQRNQILEMKRRFVRFISHEIRTPLNTVCMGLELLETELQGPSKRDKTTHSEEEKIMDEDMDFWYNVTMDIKENAHTAVEILNDLLNYDKLETGTLSLERGPVCIWDLVERTVQQFQIQAVNRKVNLKLSLTIPKPVLNSPGGVGNNGDVTDVEACAGCLCSDLLNVVGDGLKLGQVIRNLVSNALKFTPSDGIIEVSAIHVPDGLPDVEQVALTDEEETSCIHPRAGSILITVKDTGVGLSKDQLQLLFTEGVQFDANRLQHGGGSGLGLAIAKGIVEQHRGTIRADSEGQGRGTSFAIELPLFEFTAEQLKLESDDKDTASQTATTITDHDGSQEENKKKSTEKRILVAEDATSSLKMLMRLLERAGHSCVPAENGQQAVDAVKADLLAMQANPDHEPLDTILIDFEMPILKGPDATKIIREMGYPGIIIGVTGNVLSEDVEFFKDHGADEVPAKPISMAKINAYWEQFRKEATGSSSRKRKHATVRR